MKNNNMTTFIIVSGIMVLIVFSAILGVNMAPNYESSSYYAKEKDMTAHIENIVFENDKLNIETSNDTKEVCVKTTITTPDNNNICWKKVDNNKLTISAYKYKKYYIWIKDNDNNISIPTSINTK